MGDKTSRYVSLNAEGLMATTAGITYTYDGDGFRVKKSSGKLYWCGTGGQVIAESDTSGNITSEYIFFGGMRIARRDVSSGNFYNFLGDRLGNARVVTDSSGTVVEASDYYPFGQERVVTGTGAANNYKYTGHERDTESGLDHTQYRQLSSAQARWLSADPARGKPANPQSWNRYSYGNNSPCNYVDRNGGFSSVPWPLGWESWDDCNNRISGNNGHFRDDLDDTHPENNADAEKLLASQILYLGLSRAKTALQQNVACSSIFSGLMDPAKVLDEMIQGSSHGMIDYVKDAPPQISGRPGYMETTWDAKDFNEDNGLYNVVNIKVYIYTSMFDHYPGSREELDVVAEELGRMLIHELGHVFDHLSGAGGSDFMDDNFPDGTSNPDAVGNNDKLEKICVPPPN